MTESTPQTEPPGLDFGRAMPIFALVFVDILGLTVLLPLLHLYAVKFGATPLQIGLVAAAFPLAQLIGVPMMGALSDRYGRKPLLMISQVTTCVSFVMLATANSLEMVVLSRVIDGLFGANLATAQAALSDITTDDTRAQGLGLIGAAFGLGFLIGPVIAFVSLELTDDLASPAWISAGYSALSILLTLFAFKETLPREQRGTTRSGLTPLVVFRILSRRTLAILLVLMFAQQVVFYGFENLLGLFTLNRLGLTGQGNSLIFLLVGMVLVIVQARYLGKWTRRFGEPLVIRAALLLIGLGLVIFSFTPRQAHFLYVRERVEFELLQQDSTAAEAIIGQINVDLPENEDRGFGGVLWLLIAVIPISIGSGLIRPGLNSLMTKQVPRTEYGSVLGVSAAFVSAADAVAPILGGVLFQQYGAVVPFLTGGLVMLALCLVSVFMVKSPKKEEVT